MDAHPDVGSLWLTRPTDIAIHLACAVAEKRPVTLTGQGMAAHGLFAVAERGTPLFQPDPKGGTALPRVGATVKAEYYARTDAFNFFSRLVSVDNEGRWVLQAPLAVERCDRRLTKRFVVVGVSGFCMRLTEVPGQPLLGLYDISDTGVAFVADPRRHVFFQDQQVRGLLHLPGETPLEVTLEVRHSRDFPRQSNLRVYGTQFVAVKEPGKELLHEFLTHWRRASAMPH